MRALVSVVLAFVASHGVLVQTQRPAFDVVSVKVNRSGEIPMRITAPPGRFDATNVTVRLLILNAYGLRDFQLVSLPGWAGDERFDVAGRAPGEATRDEISAMVRSMLADRFQLRAHQEMREMPTYALVAAADRRPGPALRTSALDCSTPETRAKCSTRITPRSISATGMTMARLALTLSAVVGRVVTDDTGIAGSYDVELAFAPEGPLPPGATAQPQDADTPSIFTALREQLGLRLDGRRGPVEALVIDGVERPTPD